MSSIIYRLVLEEICVTKEGYKYLLARYIGTSVFLLKLALQQTRDPFSKTSKM